MVVRPARIRVGFGSWTHQECNGLLDPKGPPENARLKINATWFDHVALNSSYHRLPPRAFVENGVEQMPTGFVFDFKLPKEISRQPESAARESSLVAQTWRAAQPLIAAGKLSMFFSCPRQASAPKITGRKNSGR